MVRGPCWSRERKRVVGKRCSQQKVQQEKSQRRKKTGTETIDYNRKNMRDVSNEDGTRTRATRTLQDVLKGFNSGLKGLVRVLQRNGPSRIYS